MLLLSRVAGVLRCSTHTAKRIGCRRREVRSTTTAAAAATTTTGDGHGKGAAATGKSDGDDPHKHNILLYEAGSKVSFRVSLLAMPVCLIAVAMLPLGNTCTWHASFYRTY